MKKGTDYPLDAGNTSGSAVFTDGNNYANVFVKELYIEDKWSYENQYGELYLYRAVLNGTSTAPYICIAPRKGKGAKAVYYQLHNLSAIRCSTNGIIYFSPASLNGMNAKNGNYDRYLRTYAADNKGYDDWELTEQPTFFLINTSMDHEGVVIKGGKVVCPASYPGLWRCEASRLFVVEKGGTLRIGNAKICGGKEMCMQNYGNL